MPTQEPNELTLEEKPDEVNEALDTDLEEKPDGDVNLDEEDKDTYESEDDEEEHDEETVEALEELESEELKLLEDEAADVLLVDEVKELRAIRREELTMDVDVQVPRSDEFVCQSCFLVKRTSQLANRRKMLCADCAS